MRLKSLTKKVFQLHSWFGVVAGAFMILIGITGSMLVFTDEINDTLYESYATVSPDGSRHTYDELIAALRKEFPEGSVLRLTATENETHAYTAIVALGNERFYVYQNPYTGVVTGKTEVHSRFTNWLIRLHFTLLARPWGDAVVAVVGLLFVLLSLTGLWIQRKSLFSVYRHAIRWTSGVKVASHDLHLLFGSASVVFCFVLAVSGFYMMLYTLDGEWWTKQFAAANERNAQSSKPSEKKIAVPSRLSADSLVMVSQQLLSDFTPRSVVLPQQPKQPYRVLGYTESANPFYHEQSSYVNFDSSGTAIKVFDMREAPLTEKASTILTALHFGQFGGVFIKIIYALGGFTPALLSITGFVLWWKRRRRPAKQSVMPSVVVSPPSRRVMPVAGNAALSKTAAASDT
jgi:uncharacterized iron-regulated membrane protein